MIDIISEKGPEQQISLYLAFIQNEPLSRLTGKGMRAFKSFGKRRLRPFKE